MWRGWLATWICLACAVGLAGQAGAVTTEWTYDFTGYAPAGDLESVFGPMVAALDAKADTTFSFGTMIILSNYVSDVDEDLLTFSITDNTNPDCGASIVNGYAIYIVPVANWNGYSDVTVQVQDPDGAWDSDTLRITVNPVNDAPVVSNPAADVEVDANAPATIVDLSDVFDDIDLGDNLTFSVEGNTNSGLVTASIVGSQLTLEYAPGTSGSAEVTVRATDSESAWVEDTFTVTVNPAVGVAGRHVFYNNSAFGDATDPNKTPLLPGGSASPANYTSYCRGINGIMVDIYDMPAAATDADFAIRVNDAGNPDTWSTGPAPAVSFRPGDGVGGSDRVTLIWADGEILNQWVEVTVLATANTGLAADDVFYLANVVGDADSDGEVGSSDYGAFVGEFGLSDAIGNLAADFNADGWADLADFAIMRGAYGNSVLTPTIPPAAPEAPPAAAAAAAVVPVVSQPLDDNDASVDSITVAPLAPTIDLPAESLLAADYISGQPISGGSSVTTLQYAATGEYDLRPLGDELVTDGQGDLLVDVLAESALAVPL